MRDDNKVPGVVHILATEPCLPAGREATSRDVYMGNNYKITNIVHSFI